MSSCNALQALETRHLQLMWGALACTRACGWQQRGAAAEPSARETNAVSQSSSKRFAHSLREALFTRDFRRSLQLHCFWSRVNALRGIINVQKFNNPWRIGFETHQDAGTRFDSLISLFTNNMRCSRVTERGVYVFRHATRRGRGRGV